MGPLLFLIFIGDLGVDVNPDDAVVLKFVDDSKILKGVSDENGVKVLQENADKMYVCQEVNNMTFNPLKFQLIRIGPNEGLKEETNLFSNKMQEIILPTDEVKDLGVLVYSEANFKQQRSKAIIKTKNKMR